MNNIKVSFILTLSIIGNISLLAMEQLDISSEHKQSEQIIQEIMQAQQNTLDATATVNRLQLSLLLNKNPNNRILALNKIKTHLSSLFERLKQKPHKTLEIIEFFAQIKNCENDILQYILSSEQLANYQYKTGLHTPFDQENIQYTQLITRYQDLLKEYETVNNDDSKTQNNM